MEFHLVNEIIQGMSLGCGVFHAKTLSAEIVKDDILVGSVGQFHHLHQIVSRNHVVIQFERLGLRDAQSGRFRVPIKQRDLALPHRPGRQAWDQIPLCIEDLDQRVHR